jgi:hypothetical protein
MPNENDKKERNQIGQQPSTLGTSPATSPSPQTVTSGMPGARSCAGSEGKTESLLSSLALPKGGGAIRGIGEKFSTSAPTGTGTMRVPIATSPGRAGCGFGLELNYDSGAGNGAFGIGWSLSIPAITRKTDKGLPRYTNDESDDEGHDVFILSGAEDLVPMRVPDGESTRLDVIDRGQHRVQRYRPRVEGLFARIERFTHRTTGDIHWQVTTRDNRLSVYGRDPQARIADPELLGLGGRGAM